MREIKFNFIYGVDGEPETYFNQSFTFGEIEAQDHMDVLFDSPLLRGYSILGKRQYTGLKDKNKAEVYDGDIIDAEEENLKIVYWSNNLCMWRLKSKGESDVPICEYAIDCCEVIGNIYENPELLEE